MIFWGGLKDKKQNPRKGKIPRIFRGIFGGAYRSRTDDLLHAMQAL